MAPEASHLDTPVVYIEIHALLLLFVKQLTKNLSCNKLEKSPVPLYRAASKVNGSILRWEPILHPSLGNMLSSLTKYTKVQAVCFYMY